MLQERIPEGPALPARAASRAGSGRSCELKQMWEMLRAGGAARGTNTAPGTGKVSWGGLLVFPSNAVCWERPGSLCLPPGRQQRRDCRCVGWLCQGQARARGGARAQTHPGAARPAGLVRGDWSQGRAEPPPLLSPVRRAPGYRDRHGASSVTGGQLRERGSCLEITRASLCAPHASQRLQSPGAAGPPAPRPRCPLRDPAVPPGDAVTPLAPRAHPEEGKSPRGRGAPGSWCGESRGSASPAALGAALALRRGLAGSGTER